MAANCNGKLQRQTATANGNGKRQLQTATANGNSWEDCSSKAAEPSYHRSPPNAPPDVATTRASLPCCDGRVPEPASAL
jgi:hypothetical protein